VCPTGFKVRWGAFSWEDETPGNSRVDFVAQSADTQAALTASTPVLLATASGPPNLSFVSVGVDGQLVGAGEASHSWLRVNMTLTPTTDHMQAPTLIAWEQVYDCVPNE
jgi:hypothetical protein